MRRNKLLILLGSVCLILVLASLPFMTACPAPEEEPPPVEEEEEEEAPAEPTGELVIAVPTLITETFHPWWAPVTRKFYYNPLYDYLVGMNKEGELDPEEGIAYKWEESPDHLTWTFYIRDGVTFHDGTPLTLEDVKYSLAEMVADEKNVTCKNDIPYLDYVETIPPDKVVVHMTDPWPVLPYMLSPSGEGGGVILPQKYIEEKGDIYYESHPIGTGPYMFLEKKEGDYIKYVAQDHHWRVGTPKYKYMTFKLMPEATTRRAALQRGEVDMALVGVTGAEELSAAGFPVVEKEKAVDLNLTFLYTYKPDNPLHKKKVRQALVYAIDKAAIAEYIFMGYGKPIGHTYSMFSTSIAYKDYPVTPYDPEKARQLLAEAGYPDGFTIYYYNFATSVPEQKLVGEVIAGYWVDIGMDVVIVEMDAGAFFAIWMKSTEPLGPAAFTHSWATRPMENWPGMFNSDVEGHFFSHVADSELDRMIKEMEGAPSIEEAIELERRCEERILSEYYNTGIVCLDWLFARSKDVPDWDPGVEKDAYRLEYIGATRK